MAADMEIGPAAEEVKQDYQKEQDEDEADEEDLGIVLSEDEDAPAPGASDARAANELDASDAVAAAADATAPLERVRLQTEPVFDVGPVPIACKNGVPCCLGIDEAGRGPVIGSMVYGAAYWPLSENDSISKLGFNDSKQLGEADRERMFKVIANESERIGHVLCDLPAEYISTSMLLRNPISLNELSFRAAIGMVRRVIEAGVHVAEIYVDAVGNCERYTERLEREFPQAAITVKPKADALYKVVGAASIFAKVTRDRSLKTWVFREAFNQDGIKRPRAREFEPLLCSGYPGDEKTVRWLHANVDPVFGYPSVVRHSWKTTRNLYKEPMDEVDAADKRPSASKSDGPTICAVEWERLDGEEGVMKLSAFLTGTKRAKYFADKRLEHVHAL